MKIFGYKLRYAKMTDSGEIKLGFFKYKPKGVRTPRIAKVKKVETPEQIYIREQIAKLKMENSIKC